VVLVVFINFRLEASSFTPLSPSQTTIVAATQHTKLLDSIYMVVVLLVPDHTGTRYLVPKSMFFRSISLSLAMRLARCAALPQFTGRCDVECLSQTGIHGPQAGLSLGKPT